jgi:DNA repair exonuclease SbcCD ATPase subunit
MRNKTKFGASFIIIILSLMLGAVAYAEEKTTSDTAEKNSIKSIIKTNKEEVEKLREQAKEQAELRKEEGEEEIEGLKEEREQNREEIKTQFEAMIEATKQEREEFRTEVKNNQEEIKSKITSMRADLKEEIKKIKDENKKVITESIVNNLNELNIKLTTSFTEKITQIETVLVSVESRISKAEIRGIDVSSAKTEAGRAKQAITIARDAISLQMLKTYEVNITDEATLKTEMKRVRDLFSTDIKTVRETVRLAHQAVKNTAVALAQIPKIDDDATLDDDTEVEDNATTTNN